MALPGGDVVEELIWKIVIQSGEALGNIQAFRKQIDEMKAELKRLAVETGESIGVVAARMRREWGEETTRRMDELKNKIKEARTEIREFNKELRAPPARPVAEIKTDIGLRQQDIANYQKQLVGLSNQSKLTGAITTQALREINAETKNVTQGTKIFGIELGNLNDIARLVFGVTLLGIATQALRSVINFLQEAAGFARQFGQSMFQLETGVRALRRSGIDIATQDILENLQRINEETGNLFSNFELVAGAGQFVNLIRDLGLTREQIFQLQEAVVKLAIINGRSMEDVQRTVALALSSGYTEGLQRLGVSINRLTIAEEANRIGFEGGYTALSEFARGQATYNLLIQKSAKYADDLTEAQKRVFGQLQSTDAQIKDTQATIGQQLLPGWLLLNKAVLALIGLLKRLPSTQIARFGYTVYESIKALPAVWERAAKATDNFVDRLKIVLKFLLAIGAAFRKLEPLQPILAEFAGFEDIALGEKEFTAAQEKLANALEQFGSEITNLDEEIAERRKKIEEDLQEDLARIASDGVGDRLQIERDYASDLDKLERDAAARREKLARDLQQRLSEIDIRLEFDLSEAQLRFDFDVQETIIKFNEDVAKANEEFRQRERDRERQFNEEMLRIREDYLVDLEDALMERDAKAVLRARRGYILEKNRAERENEINKEKNKEALQEDLVAAAQRRDARIRELEFELQQRRAALERQAQFDREAAQRRFQEDLDELRINLQREKYERWIAYLEQKRDQQDREKAEHIQRLLKYENEKKELTQFEDDKLRIIGEHLAQQAELMQLGSDAVLQVIKTYFGEGGLALKIFESYVDAVNRLLKQISVGATPTGEEVEFTLKGGPATSYQRGGALVARKPTTVQFGEVPEVAIFAPLSELDKLPGLLGDFIGSPLGGEGKLAIQISLDQGLIAEIVDSSLDGVANVVLEVQRRS